MKRKILSILVVLTLVLGMSLVTAVPAAAEDSQPLPSNSAYTFTNLTNLQTTNGARRPSFSPDGKKIVYTKGYSPGSGQIWVMNSDGTNAQQIDGSESGYIGSGSDCDCAPFWSSDGDSIIWSGGTDTQGEAIAVDVTISISGTYTYSAPYTFFGWTTAKYVTANITSGTSAVQAGYECQNPSWFPGHDEIVFWVAFTNGQTDLFAYTKGVDALVRITDTPDYSEYEPQVSPDGTKIIYWAGETTAEEGPNVYTVPTPTGSPIKDLGTLIASQADYPTYNSDGTKIAFAYNYGSGETSNRDIYITNASGTFEDNLTGGGPNGTADSYEATFGPNGEIAFASTSGANASTTYNIWLATPIHYSVTLTGDSTEAIAPTVTTSAATSVAFTLATLNGSLSNMGKAVGNATADSVIVSFMYGTTSGTENFSSTTTTLTGNGTFSAMLSGLTQGTKYYFVAMAQPNDMTAAVSGSEGSFTTAKITTDAATVIGAYTATLNGQLDLGSATGASVALSFEYGTTTGYGTTVTANPSTLTQSGAFSFAILRAADLIPNDTYNFEAVGKIGNDIMSGVNRTVTLVPVIGISVNPTSINFGSITAGHSSGPQLVTVTNTGDYYNQTFTTSLSGTDAAFYTSNLKIDTTYTAANWSATNVAAGNHATPSLVLSIPIGTTAGVKTATIIFWAESTTPAQ